jgi:predicted transposase YdaD
MPSKDFNLNKKEFKEPMVIFPLRQYETLMEHIEEIEDCLAVYMREKEPNLSQQEVEEMFKKKFDGK